MASKKSLGQLSEKEKKLLEKLQKIKEEKRKLIKEKRFQRIVSETVLKYAFPISFFISSFPLSLGLRFEKEPVVKAFILMTFLYRCNRGKAVHNPCYCFGRLYRELREFQESKLFKETLESFKDKEDEISTIAYYYKNVLDMLGIIANKICQRNPELLKEYYSELKKFRTPEEKLRFTFSTIFRALES